MTTSNQKAQHPIAPPVAETVPQWCRALFAELCGRGYFNYQHKEESITGKEIIAIICKHSPNAQPMQAVNDDVKAVFATVKEQAYKLPNKCECSGSEPCVTCELLARIDDLERSLELARHAPKAVPQQGVPEIPPAAAVWPRYFEQRNCRGPYKRLRFESPTVCKWADGLASHLNLSESMPKIFSMEAVLQTHIETDAEGNALPEKQEASGVERWDVRSVITLGDEPPYVIEKCRSGQFVKAADHDRVVADLQRKLQIREAEIGIGGSPPPYPTWMQQVESRDATIAELNKDAKEDHAVILAYQRRAEAAEAEVARLHKIVGDCELVAFDNCNPPQLWSWIGDWEGGAAEPLQRIKNAKDAVKEIADLTAQLAAANERIREAYAILCQLDNVYRRQSTESVGSFSVTQEVHSLLKRAMDTLNGKGRK